MRPCPWRLTAIAVIAGLGVATSASTAELNPAAVIYKLPDQIEWKDPPLAGAGPKTAVVVGDPTKPGMYVVLVKWSPNQMSRPHFHPNDRFITVIKGTWWVGSGNKFDPESTVPMPAGSFVTHFGKQVHYDGAKGEETIIEIVGEGPATTTRVEEAK